jgi:hypothetical protein
MSIKNLQLSEETTKQQQALSAVVSINSKLRSPLATAAS